MSGDRTASSPVLTARRRRRLAGAALTVGCLAGALLTPSPAFADRGSGPGAGTGSTAVIWWNEAAGRAALASCLAPVNNPLHESRMYAMTHIAIYDALNAIKRTSQPYTVDFRAPADSAPDAAVAAAAHDVLVTLLGQLPAPFSDCVPAAVTQVESDYATALSAIPAGAAREHGLVAGQQAAAAVLAERTGDGADTPLFVTDYPQGTAPGAWRFTPGTDFAFAPGWGDVTPFALDTAGQFPVKPPLKVTGARYAKDVNEIQALGGDGVTTPSARTPAQTETAMFWVESSPLAWNRIARSLATMANLDLWQQARLFGLLDIAMADGYIASFDTKYTLNFWRPVTAIRAADTDGNDRTTADPTWTPLITTPPIPDHDSAHSVEGAAAAAVFRAFFGTDKFTFTACSRTLTAGTCTDASPTTHSFTRFSQAADENAVSRIYVGIHFRYAIEQGLKHGASIGSWVACSVMRPAR
jgi:hypothetical protein